ncbi:unnamed protein product [Dibothriocephalus latus]|uniref:Uncharacterized protein n=1 Tax=Dibothriocephalus latus TaxID=60516 RepID=A0A3P7MZ91_DIBLA|nr:unnamed protein product [Dibothriocephalus latus]
MQEVSVHVLARTAASAPSSSISTDGVDRANLVLPLLQDVPPVAQDVALAEATMDPHVGLQPAFEFSGSLPCVGFPDGFGGGSLAGQSDSERETLLRNFVLLLSMEQRENAVNGTFRNCLMADRVLSQNSGQTMP